VLLGWSISTTHPRLTGSAFSTTRLASSATSAPIQFSLDLHGMGIEFDAALRFQGRYHYCCALFLSRLDSEMERARRRGRKVVRKPNVRILSLACLWPPMLLIGHDLTC
jgi:hypothetical protein